MHEELEIAARRWAKLGLVVCLIAAAICVAITVIHAGGTGCRLGPFDCERVLDSRYGHAFGLPLAVFAFAYSMSMAVLFGRAAGVPSPDIRTIATALAVFSAAGFVTAFVLLAVSVVILSAVCPFCLGLDACLLIATVCALRVHAATRDEYDDDQSWWRLPAIVFASALLGATLLDHLAKRTGAAGEHQPIGRKRDAFAAPPPGTCTAVLIINPTCLHCAEAWSRIRRLQRSTPISIAVGILPFDAEVLDAAEHSGAGKHDPDGALAGAVAYCAAEQGLAAPFLDHHFAALERDGQASPRKIRRAAEQSGLDLARLEECAGSIDIRWTFASMPQSRRRAYGAHVRTQLEQLEEVEAPALFIDNRRAPIPADDSALLSMLRHRH